MAPCRGRCVRSPSRRHTRVFLPGTRGHTGTHRDTRGHTGTHRDTRGHMGTPCLLVVPARSLPSAGCGEEEEVEEEAEDKEALWHVRRAVHVLVASVQQISAVSSPLGQVRAAGMCGRLCWNGLGDWAGCCPGSGLPRCTLPGPQGPCKPCAHCGFLHPMFAVPVQVSLLPKATWTGSPGRLQLLQKLEKHCGRSMRTPGLAEAAFLSIPRPNCYAWLLRAAEQMLQCPSEGCISLGEEMNPFNSGHNL